MSNIQLLNDAVKMNPDTAFKMAEGVDWDEVLIVGFNADGNIVHSTSYMHPEQIVFLMRMYEQILIDDVLADGN